ncbi:MAG TPA: hypothetical protein DCY13_06875, partial [Verrucomicrobiales bacterium]|nr:hypothetical protein [Verrucomicrobiales bacterium]
KARPATGGTYYRLLSQLGTTSGTEPETFNPGLGVDSFTATNASVPYHPSDKINLNYDNRAGVWDPANPKNWEPLAFFTNAADRMLRSQAFVGADGRMICLTNIMVWPTNNYDAAVHRVLQVAANLYDATGQTNYLNVVPGQPQYPTVFRPYLRKEFINGFTNVYIAGYQRQDLVGDILDPEGFVRKSAYWDLDGTNVVEQIPLNPNPLTVQPMALGVPMVIGAKKGLPNFNELAVETAIQVQRNVQLFRPNANSLPAQTNEFYILGITNLFGLEAWNSYQAAYPRPLQLAIEVDFDMAIVSSNGAQIQWPATFVAGSPPVSKTFTAQLSIPSGTWSGRQFQVPIMTNHIFLTNSVYTPVSYPRFRPAASNVFAGLPTTPNQFFIPDWNLRMTNRVRFILTDGVRIIDYANIDRLTWGTNIIDAMVLENDRQGASQSSQPWLMNRFAGTQLLNDPTEGLVNQLMMSAGFLGVGEGIWRNYAGEAISGRDKDLAIDAFRAFAFQASPQYFPGRGNPVSANGLIAQAPFTPTKRLVLDRRYQVNDPLVHYTAGDLAIHSGAQDAISLPPGTAQSTNNFVAQSIGEVNNKYTPWPGDSLESQKQKDSSSNQAIQQDPLYTDPLAINSDAWNFPTNKLPNIGWMGRVHRGTPWQSLFFKADRRTQTDSLGQITAGPPMDEAQWIKSDRGTVSLVGNGSTMPRRDWSFAGLFTTAPSVSATRGQLSINQPGEASWSAVLAGVLTLTNDQSGGISAMAMSSQTEPVVIQPGSDAMRYMVDGINNVRTAQFGGQYRQLGDILSVPQLTVDSPFMNRRGGGQGILDLVDDAAMERIPQQIMSLLRLGEPRFVIYAFGQTLKPAPFSIVLDPDYTGLVTNYQVTGEAALRSVVRFERIPPVVQPSGLVNTNEFKYQAVVIETKVLPPQ